jgi:Tfp pilus assembly protein PilF
MGVVYGRQGHHSGAQTQFQKALDISIRAVGFNHPQVAIGHVNLAWINMKQGKESECKAHLEHALETGFVWQCKSFLQTDNVFDPVRQADWFEELLSSSE